MVEVRWPLLVRNNITNYAGFYIRALSWLLENVREDVDSNHHSWSSANTQTLTRDSCKGYSGSGAGLALDVHSGCRFWGFGKKAVFGHSLRCNYYYS